ncbi:MAG: zinc ribbon domain-containing protein [bacterium]|nr:zinc ribbon domain-containing protein [Betaproteobacteria bacterium]
MSCTRCGLVFSKWVEARSGRSSDPDDEVAGRPVPAWREGRVGEFLARLAVPPQSMGSGSRIAHGLLLAALFLYSWPFILGDVRTADAWNGFLHGVNLVFHEAGHMLMIPFGRFMHVLGGTLGQLAMPLIVAVAFIVKRDDTVGASVGLWWFGQSLTDCAPYIADARKLQLELLGGGTGAERDGHDWEYLLNTLGIAQYDILLGNLVKLAGGAVMLLAVAWGGWMLLQAHRQAGPPR